MLKKMAKFCIVLQLFETNQRLKDRKTQENRPAKVTNKNEYQ